MSVAVMSNVDVQVCCQPQPCGSRTCDVLSLLRHGLQSLAEDLYCMMHPLHITLRLVAYPESVMAGLVSLESLENHHGMSIAHAARPLRLQLVLCECHNFGSAASTIGA